VSWCSRSTETLSRASQASRDEIVRRDDATLSGVKRMRLCQTGIHQFVVAAFTPSSNLALTSWELRAPLVLDNLDVSWTLQDALRPVFERVKVSQETAEACLVGDRGDAV
jgi:hypothetical protein